MKPILEFNLEDYENKIKNSRCVKADDMYHSLWEFSVNSKKMLEDKFEEENIINIYDALDLMFDNFNNILKKNNINIYDLKI